MASVGLCFNLHRKLHSIQLLQSWLQLIDLFQIQNNNYKKLYFKIKSFIANKVVRKIITKRRYIRYLPSLDQASQKRHSRRKAFRFLFALSESFISAHATRSPLPIVTSNFDVCCLNLPVQLLPQQNNKEEAASGQTVSGKKNANRRGSLKRV